jgi:hypothetical protein
VLSVLLTPRNQRLGDLVAGTLVVRERTGAVQPTATTFWVPAGYERYAESLDVSGLSAADYGAVRTFLLRAGSLEPRLRQDLAAQIAGPLLARLRHTPPPWVSPEALLACIAAVYQHRARAGVAQAPAPAPTVVAPVPVRPPDADRAGGYVPPS